MDAIVVNVRVGGGGSPLTLTTMMIHYGYFKMVMFVFTGQRYPYDDIVLGIGRVSMRAHAVAGARGDDDEEEDGDDEDGGGGGGLILMCVE